MSTVKRVELWFDSIEEAHKARATLDRLGIISKRARGVVFLKDMYNANIRGWGFDDPKVGTMAKIAVGK